MRISLRVVLYLAVIFGGPSEAATTFQIPDSMLAEPLVLIAYGDIRFTASSETAASSPTARRALVARIAAETWLESQMTSLDPAVRVVLIVMHHPPVADVQTVKLVDHNVRPNEQALAAYLQTAAAHSAARIVVSASHIHNYERLSQDGVTYLVSGGGGATPYQIERTAADLYQGTHFPNYHYVRFELREVSLSGEMIRLQDYAARSPSHWQTKDRFEISLQP